ncbi:MAG: hypothetical protein P1V20_21625 [Verrucomicrobiales bacterium]|nr:hypothetical protein [Verrucomicrobiales bacterium]
MSKGFIILLVAIFPWWLAVSDESTLTIETFLASETLEKVGIRQQELEKVLYDLLNGSLAEAPDLAGKILPHARQLVIHEQLQNDGWYESMWNGWTHTGSWFQRYLRSRSQAEAIGVMIRTFREDRAGSVASLGFTGRNQTDAMVAIFNAGGGNYKPATGMKTLAQELRKLCGEGDMVYLVPYFYSLNYQLRPAQRRAAIQWARSVEGFDPLFPVAEAYLTGTALVEISWNRKLGEEPFSRVRSLQLAEEILMDDNISLAWRGGFATFLGHDNKSCWGSEAGIATGKVIAEILEQATPYASNSFSYAFPLFLRADRENPEWKSTGRRILRAWEERNRFNNTSKRKGRAFDPSNYWVVPVFDLACRLKDEAAIDKMLEEFSTTMHVAPAAVMHLVIHGYNARAKKLLFRQVEKREYSLYRYRRENIYNAELHRKVPGFLKSIPKRQDREFAALHFASIVDPYPFPQDAAFPNRETRLFQLLEQGEFTVPEAGLRKKRVLEMLSLAVRNPRAAELLREHTPLPESTNNSAQSLGSYWGTRAAIFSELEELEKGFDLPMRFQLGRIAFDESKWFNANRRRACEGLITQLSGRLATAYGDRDRKRLADFLPVCRLAGESVPLNTGLHSFLVYLAGVHALLDEMDVYEEWWQSLDGPRKKSFAKLLQDEGAYISYNAHRINPYEVSPDKLFPSTQERRRYMTGLLANPWTDCGYEDRNSLAYAESKSLLTEGDIHFLAGHLAEKSPRRGCAYREWFGSLADRGMLAEALKLALMPYPQTESDPYFKECLLWELTLLHEAAGRRGVAREYLDSLRKHTGKSGFRMKGYDEFVLSILEKRLEGLPE